ncbi:MAG: redoxin domain-containing protein [Deltaproteobacteria bacterium]|nr:redoxin domain-containing protein [Deltaproteobacteria bacterium]
MSRFQLRRKMFGMASVVLRPEALLGAGSVAPAFELQTHDGRTVSSEALKGKRGYVLVFYPGDDTPGCTLQLQAFSSLVDDFDAAGYDVYGVNPADAGSHTSFVGKCSLRVPLLVDTDRKLAETYLTARPGVPVTFRSVFLVDKKGIVRIAMKDMPDPQSLLSTAQRSGETGFKGSGRKGRRLAPRTSAYGMRKIQENDTRTVVLDIRDAVDWRHGHIAGAINIPYEQIEGRLGELPDKDVPIVIADDQGLRASGIAHILGQAGWRKLFALNDGMEAYKGPRETASE